MAALEDADAEGRFATLTLNSGLSVQVRTSFPRKSSLHPPNRKEIQLMMILLMQVPIGGRYIGIPGTESAENPRGVMVEVHWEQDDSGALCISHHSPEMPIPSHIELTTSASAPTHSTTTTNTNFWSQGKQQIHGIVIDPAQIINSNL